MGAANDRRERLQGKAPGAQQARHIMQASLRAPRNAAMRPRSRLFAAPPDQ
jgi:hypothetical protein